MRNAIASKARIASVMGHVTTPVTSPPAPTAITPTAPPTMAIANIRVSGAVTVAAVAIVRVITVARVVTVAIVIVSIVDRSGVPIATRHDVTGVAIGHGSGITRHPTATTTRPIAIAITIAATGQGGRSE